ncbi:hypothetical protein KCU65_g128, partial [Aureobasidium melanogenum]
MLLSQLLFFESRIFLKVVMVLPRSTGLQAHRPNTQLTIPQKPLSPLDSTGSPSRFLFLNTLHIHTRRFHIAG